MIWQNIVISGGSIGFLLVNILVMRSRDKPPATMSFMTAAILVGFVAVHASYGVWYGATCQAATAIQWAIIGWQKTRQNKAQNKRNKPWAI